MHSLLSLVLLALLCNLTEGLAANAENSAEQRAQFAQAYRALRAGRHAKAKQLSEGLEQYPLYPYLRYHEIKRRLHAVSVDDVKAFLTAYEGSLLAERLRNSWLKRLHRERRWQQYVEDYRPRNDTKLRCNYLRARIETGALEGVSDQTRALWLVGKSQPKECDAAFAHFEKSGAIDDELRWQRIKLSFENKKAGLARYLARGLADESLREASKHWLAVHKNPVRGVAHKYFDNDTALTREIVVYGITRLARIDVDKASSLWRQQAKRFDFSKTERAQALGQVAISAASDNHGSRLQLLDQIPNELASDALEKYRVREALELGAWEKLARWTAQSPRGSVSILRWRYWHARALQETGQADAANEAFRQLAIERDYYGFLSADKLGLEYQMNDRPIIATEKEIAAFTARPGIIRARELFEVEMPFEARREWAHEVARLSERELEVAAAVVSTWGWHDRAILALGKAKSYDDLSVRFPLLYESDVRRSAKERGLAPSTIYSIMRTESAFMADARSPAGALGLMQLMPATGRETAAKLGIGLPNAKGLLDPSKNITLGSAYLKRVLKRFGGSFSMAAAAYNAGPHRVKSWLPQSACVPADIWIDTIPFTETRRYVRRTAFYATLYQWKLGETLGRISDRITAVDSKGMRKQC